MGRVMHGLGWLGWLALVVGIVWRPEQQPMAAISETALETSGEKQPAAQVIHSEAFERERRRIHLESQMLHMQVGTLEEKVTDLEAALEHQKGEARRYRRGLERAVDQLNILARAPKPSAGRAAPTRRASRSRKGQGGVLRAAAQVQILGDRLFVSGEIKSRKSEWLSGRLWIELLRDGQVIDSVSSLAEVDAAGKLPFSHTFPLSMHGRGTFSARGRFEY